VYWVIPILEGVLSLLTVWHTFFLLQGDSFPLLFYSYCIKESSSEFNIKSISNSFSLSYYLVLLSWYQSSKEKSHDEKIGRD
jgi:hypothetical protein